MANLATVQTATGEVNGTSLSATWGATTVRGNALFMMIAWNGAATPSITLGSSAWKLILTAGGTNSGFAIYGISPQCSTARSGAESVTLGISKKHIMILAEVSGMFPEVTPSSDGTFYYQANAPASYTGTSTTAGSASSTGCYQPVAYGIRGFSGSNVYTWSAPTTGFTIIKQYQYAGGGGASTKCTAALVLGEITPQGTDTGCQLTLSSSSDWATDGGVLDIVPTTCSPLTGVGY